MSCLQQISTAFISIHAPRRGSDAESVLDLVLQLDFNPRPPQGERPKESPGGISPNLFQSTPPAGGATGVMLPGRMIEMISIHAPRRGSDPRLHQLVPGTIISIHAPRRGSDMRLIISATIQYNFNPRSPQGERHAYYAWYLGDDKFQSTLPAGGATYQNPYPLFFRKFQSTLPAGGATLLKKVP